MFSIRENRFEDQEERRLIVVPGENQKVVYLIELMDDQSNLENHFRRDGKLPEYKNKRGLIRNVVVEQSKNKVTVKFFFLTSQNNYSSQ